MVKLNLNNLKIADNHDLEYRDNKNNLYINLYPNEEGNLSFNYNQEDIILELNILDGQKDKKKPRAPKGLSREIMCHLLEYILEKQPFKDEETGKKINFTKKTKIYTAPSDIHKLGNFKGLIKMYENMSFTPSNVYYGEKGEELHNYKTTIGNLLKWCSEKYESLRKSKVPEKPKAKSKPKAKAKASGDGQIKCKRCDNTVKKASFSGHVKTAKCKRGKV